MRYGKAHLVYLGGENEQGIPSKQTGDGGSFWAGAVTRLIFLSKDIPATSWQPAFFSAPRQREYLRAALTKEPSAMHQS